MGGVGRWCDGGVTVVGGGANGEATREVAPAALGRGRLVAGRGGKAAAVGKNVTGQVAGWGSKL